VEVVAIASKLPDVIEYDGEKLTAVGDVATVADLIVPEGVEIKAEPNQQVASVFEPSAVAAANDAAGGDTEADESKVEAEQGGDEAAAEKTEAGAKSEEK